MVKLKQLYNEIKIIGNKPVARKTGGNHYQIKFGETNFDRIMLQKYKNHFNTYMYNNRVRYDEVKKYFDSFKIPYKEHDNYGNGGYLQILNKYVTFVD